MPYSIVHPVLKTPPTKPEISYKDFLEKVTVKKKKVEDVENYFFDLIHNKVPSYWIGTKWDFNGTTLKPQVGKIACGYFITNNLYNLGFKINRFKLAQEPSSYLIKELCASSTIKHFASIEKLHNYLGSELENDVFIVGLDFHTGFITKEGNEYYFIHSDYINKEGVKKEKTLKSKALNASNSFMIGSLMQNKELLENWVDN